MRSGYGCYYSNTKRTVFSSGTTICECYQLPLLFPISYIVPALSAGGNERLCGLRNFRFSFAGLH